MTSLEHLLPGPDELVRCADHGRRIGLDPGGTAIRADRFVVVDTPRPWPKPVFAHDRLAGVREVFADAAIPTRVLAAVPGASADGIDVAVYDRGDRDQVFEHRYRPADRGELLDLALELATIAAGTSARSGMPVGGGPLESPVALVCTQGSHDVCCGSEGARFAAAAESVDGLVVRRVSHTGGHRFAPTLVTLPDGRMWADADLDLLYRVLNRAGDAADVADRCRGWWGADPGPAQVAERVILAEVGWNLEAAGRTVTVLPAAPPSGLEDEVGETLVRVAAEVGEWTVGVRPSRRVPTIGCRVAGGQPAKSHQEHEVVSLVAG